MEWRNLIFDLDGTLVNSLPGIEFSVDAALAERNLRVRSSGLLHQIGPPIRKILLDLAGPLPEAELDALELAFRKSYDAEGWRKTLLYPGARQILQQARQQGSRLFIATNKPTLATGSILAALEVRPFFEEVFCRDSQNPPFPSKAAMIARLLSQAKLHLNETIYVGDTAEDFEAASAVGLSTALVSHGYGNLQFGSTLGYRLIDHFSELAI